MKKILVFLASLLILAGIIWLIIIGVRWFLISDYWGNDSRDDTFLVYDEIYDYRSSNCPEEQIFDNLEIALQEPNNVCRLEFFRTAENPFYDIPNSISRFTKLKELSIQGYDKPNLPPVVWEIKNLESLEISQLKSTRFPLGITKLKSLKILILSSNNFEDIPKEISNLSNLTTLEMGRYGKISSEIGNLPNLKELLLRYPGNNFDGKCPDIERLINLEKLSYPCDISELSKVLPKLKKLKRLFYSGTPTTIPDEIGEVSNLEVLFIDTTNLTYISKEIGKLKNLKILSIRGSRISREERNRLIKLLPNTNILISVPWT